MNHQNKAKLILHAGGDTSHAAAAWTSTGLELTVDQIPRIPKLLEKLEEGSDGNMHGTPFEKSYLQFNVTCDVASHIHFLKHRVGTSINAESARYREYREDKYYVPQDWPSEMQEDLSLFIEEAYGRYHRAVASLVAQGLSRTRAKESARYFLPYGIQINLDVSFNWRSFANFLKLRNAPHAQTEIRELAEMMLNEVKSIPENPFKYTLKAFDL